MSTRHSNSRHLGKQFLPVDAGLVIAKFRNRSREVGLIAAIKSTVQQEIRMNAPAQNGRDARYGTDTGGTIGLWRYRLNSPNAVHGRPYQAIGQTYAVSLLSGIPRSAPYVDLGCG